MPQDFDHLVSHSTNGEDHLIPYPYMNSSSIFATKFARQVISILLNPKLLENPNISEEAKKKATSYFNIKNFSIGAYSESQGIGLIRKNLVKWYTERDGFKPEEEDFFLTYGRINSYEHVMTTIAEVGEGVIVPNPCYPFYLNMNRAMGLENVYFNYENLNSLDYGDSTKKLKINVSE